MVNEDAALLNRRVTHMTPAALFSRRLQDVPIETAGKRVKRIAEARDASKSAYGPAPPASRSPFHLDYSCSCFAISLPAYIAES